MSDQKASIQQRRSQKMKSQPKEWEKIPANCMSDAGLLFRNI